MAQTMSDMKKATLAYYPLKGDANDYSSNNRNGTATNNLSYVPGIYGFAANFQTSGASVQLPLDSFSRYADQYTLSAWVNLAHCSPVSGEKSDLGIIAGRLYVSYRTGKLMFFFYYDRPGVSDNKFFVLESMNILPTEVWINVLVMYDHATRNLSFFLNGIPDSVVSLSEKVAPSDRPHLPVAFSIGGSYPVFDDHDTFNGSISDVIIMNTVLDTTCVNCVSGVMNFTGIRGGDKEITRYLAGVHSEDEAFPFIAFFVISVIIALASNYIYLLTKIESEKFAPPSPKELTLEQIAAKIAKLVGRPARPGMRATRQEVGIPPLQKVQVDIGGLGHYFYVEPPPENPMECGFIDSLNLNDVTNNADSNPPNQAVPNLILVSDWIVTKPRYPLGDGFADYVTMQSAPLYEEYVTEIARIVRLGGSVGLWIAQEQFQDQINELARIFNCTPLPCTAQNGNLEMDEFKGNYALPKLILTKNR